MIGLPVVPWCAMRRHAARSRSLSAGRAPTCWQDELRQAGDKGQRLANACAWLDDVVPGRLPRLAPQSLLGNCLGELVDAAPPPAGPPKAPSTRAPRHARPAGELAEQPHRRQPFAEAEGPAVMKRRATESVPTAVTKSATTVGDALLSQLAGRSNGLPMLPSQPSKSAPTPPEATGPAWKWFNRAADEKAHKTATTQLPVAGKRKSMPSAVTGSRPEKVPLPAALEIGGREWLPTVAQRVQRRLAAASAMTANAESLAIMAEQWRLDLHGPAAPSHLLATGQPGRLADTGSRTEKPTGNTSAAMPPAATGRPQMPSASAEGRPPRTTAAHSLDPAGKVNAPQMAPVLPPLRAQPAVPIAAASAEASGQRERAAGASWVASARATAVPALPAPEDLDELARKLKQILDEESRRHGINV